MFSRSLTGVVILDNEQWKLLVGSTNLETNQINVTQLGTYSNFDKLKSAINEYNLSHIVYCVTGQYSVTYTTNLLTDLNLSSERRSRAIDETQICDYFSFANSSILATLPKDDIAKISSFQPELGLKCSFSITHADVLLTYLTLRTYPEKKNNCIGIFNFEQNYINLIVLQNANVKTTLWTKIKTDQDLTTQLVNLLKTASRFCEQPQRKNAETSVSSVSSVSSSGFDIALPTTIGSFDMIFGVGECTLELLIETKRAALREKISIGEIELFDCLRAKFININDLSTDNTAEFEGFSYRYSVAVAALAMRSEKLGIDLTLNEQLNKTLTPSFTINYDENILEIALAKTTYYAKKVVPSVEHQKLLVITVLILTLGFGGYRYYSYYSELSTLASNYAQEKAKENALAGIKTDYEILLKKNKIKNDRITAIKKLQSSQLLVSTIFSEIESLSYQSQFRDLVTINDLEIAGADLKLSGVAIDKTGAVNFVNEIQKNGLYDDVIPRYTAIDTVKVNYELTTRYVGQIPRSQFPLPLSSNGLNIQVAKK